MLENLFIKNDFDNEALTVTFSTPKGYAKVNYSVLEGDAVCASGEVELEQDDKEAVFEVALPGLKPWSIQNPFLYKLKLNFDGDEGPIEIEQTFGMRKVHVENREIYFNNKPFYVRGFIRGREAHDHPNLMGVSETEYYEKNIRMAKAFGFNFIRFHSKIPPIEFLEAADRLGILCHVEIRKYFGKYQKERVIIESEQSLVNEDDWRNAILRLRNHPCIMVYCMGNEINSPGVNPEVKKISALTKELDPTRLFLDTCSRGEYDRDTVDIDVQHMSYYAPFGRHYDMFDDSSHLSIYGSVAEKRMTVQDDNFVMSREVLLNFPLIAHEVCHYTVMRDPFKLDEKFKKYGAEKPWWIDELIKMIKAKGHEKQFQKMLEASTRFQYIWMKQGLESVRKSPLLQGLNFLQLSDTERYENANGLIDCFDDVKDIPPENILPFNGPTVIVADLPRRTFMGNTKINVPIFISHYPTEDFESGNFSWELKNKNSGAVIMSGCMKDFDLSRRGNRKLCRLELNLPEVENPE